MSSDTKPFGHEITEPGGVTFGGSRYSHAAHYQRPLRRHAIYSTEQRHKIQK